MPSNKTKNFLQQIIMQETYQVLREQAEPALDLDLGGGELDSIEMPADDAEVDLDSPDASIDGDTEGLDGDADDALGDGEDGSSDNPEGGGDDSLDGGDDSMDFGGGFGGGGGGFGGGGGSDLGGGGDDLDSDGDSAPADDGTATPTAPEDPVQGTVEAVKEAQAGTDDAEPIQNPQELTAVAKAHIQDKFTNFNDPNVQAVINLMTSDPDQTIQDVGRRLSMFIRGF